MKSKLLSFKSIALFGIAMLFLSNGVCQKKTTASEEKKSPDVIVKTTNVTPANPKADINTVQISEVTFVEKGKTTKDQVEIKDNNTPYYTVNEIPVYVDGKKELPNYVSRTAKYPKEAIKDKAQGIVMVQIIVEKDGSVSNPKVINSVHPKLDEEAVRVASTLKFTPGKQNGEVVRCYYQVPVPFVLLPAKK
ncbi:MAG: energy transducer TonB [Lentimicrobiaceae bacterium]|nr:energy transducer TonB [Lentimicrobiaceae bacterium]